MSTIITQDNAVFRDSERRIAGPTLGAAIANALYRATGVHLREYPLMLDKILQGMA